MSAIVFLGPTLPVEEAQAVFDAIYLPPVAQGDIYRALARHPAMIGIVDGYFDFVPAVWHKEILLALSKGVPVFGSASTGALRAAELWPFGMQGVGRIFEAFRDGVFEDDDEVALVHAPAALKYQALSEPMVNIRASLARAVAEGVIGEAARLSLITIAKGLFYQERTWPRVMALGAEAELPAPDLAALPAFCAERRVDQKRLDALAMLRRMREATVSAAPRPVDFHFENTWLSAWAQQVAGTVTDDA